MIRILKEGDKFSIITNCACTYVFMQEFSKELARITEDGCFENDLEFQFEHIFEIVPDVMFYFGHNDKTHGWKIFGDAITVGMVVI